MEPIRASPPRRERVNVAVGAIVMAGVILAGGPLLVLTRGDSVRGWPFAAYPIFAGIQGPTDKTIDVVPVRGDVELAPLAVPDIVPWMATDRIAGMLSATYAAQDPNHTNALADVVVQYANLPPGTTHVRLYRAEILVSPGPQLGKPVWRELLLSEPVRTTGPHQREGDLRGPRPP